MPEVIGSDQDLTESYASVRHQHPTALVLDGQRGEDAVGTPACECLGDRRLMGGVGFRCLEVQVAIVGRDPKHGGPVAQMDLLDRPRDRVVESVELLIDPSFHRFLPSRDGPRIGRRRAAHGIKDRVRRSSGLELFERAALRVAVGAPADHGRRVAEPAALQALVADLADELRLERDPLRVAAAAPAARSARAAALAEARTADERFQRLAELAPFLRAERGGVADVLERALAVVEAQEEAAHPIALALQAISTHHAIGRAVVLHLDHHALALHVALLGALGDDAVLSHAVDVCEPAARRVGIARSAA